MVSCKNKIRENNWGRSISLTIGAFNITLSHWTVESSVQIVPRFRRLDIPYLRNVRDQWESDLQLNTLIYPSFAPVTSWNWPDSSLYVTADDRIMLSV